MPHKLERPSAALASPKDSDLWLVGLGRVHSVDIPADPGIGRAGGVGGAGKLVGELPRRVKLSFNYNDAACISIEETSESAGAAVSD